LQEYLDYLLIKLVVKNQENDIQIKKDILVNITEEITNDIRKNN